MEKIEKVNEALEKVEEYLGEHEFICGGAPTIADFCIAVITSTLEVVNHDMSNFPKIMSHLRICMELIRGWDEVGQFRATRYGQWYRAALEAAESGGKLKMNVFRYLFFWCSLRVLSPFQAVHTFLNVGIQLTTPHLTLQTLNSTHSVYSQRAS